MLRILSGMLALCLLLSGISSILTCSAIVDDESSSTQSTLEDDGDAEKGLLAPAGLSHAPLMLPMAAVLLPHVNDQVFTHDHADVLYVFHNLQI